MTVIFSHPLTADFSGVRSLQANGTNPSGSSSPAGNGTQLTIVDGWMRALLTDTDAPFAGGQRSEITGPDEAVPSERLYRWEMRPGADWVYDSTAFVVTQIHTNPDASAVAENFWITCDGRWYRALIPNVGVPADVAAYRAIAAWPFVAGRTHRLALHARWDKTSTGWLSLIVDGRLLAAERQTPTSYNHTVGPYFKLGVYMPSHAYSGWGSRTMYARNLIATDGVNGQSWADLLGDVPRPVPVTVRGLT